MFDFIEFIISEALQSLRRNGWMSLAAVTTTAMALFLIGGLGYSYIRIQSYLDKEARDFKLRVFLKDEVQEADFGRIKAEISGLKGVAAVAFISDEDALKKFQADIPSLELSDLFSAEDNVMPNGYQVQVEEISQARALAAEIRKFPGIEKVQEASDLVKLLEELLFGLRLLGVLLGSIMLLTGGILIFNTIRLTILARRREMRIMELVGATRSAIILPLLMEGMVQGMLGGLLAGLLLWLASMPVQAVMEKMELKGLWASLDVPSTLIILISAGAAYGLICSLLAVRERRDASTAIPQAS